MEIRLLALCSLIMFQVHANDNSNTDILQAIKDGNSKLVQACLDAGVSVETKNKHGYTLLGLAAFYKQANIAQLLLAHGANPNKTQTEDKLAPIHIATHLRPSIEVLKVLLKHEKINLEKRWYGKTALHYAVKKNRPEMVALLCKSGANKNAKCSQTGFTAMHFATTTGWIYKEMVPLLRNQGAGSLWLDKNNRTALEVGLAKHKSENDKRQLKKLLFA